MSARFAILLFKPDDRFKEAREKYHTSTSPCISNWRYDEESAKASSPRTIFHLEKNLAENLLDNVGLARPANNRPQDVFCAFTNLRRAWIGILLLVHRIFRAPL